MRVGKEPILTDGMKWGIIAGIVFLAFIAMIALISGGSNSSTTDTNNYLNCVKQTHDTKTCYKAVYGTYP